MLAVHWSSMHAGFMEHGPKLSDSGAADEEDLWSPKAGDLIGPCRLVRVIGHGGMGTVWLSEQADGALKSQVALKLPHMRWDRADIAERFARERSVLSTLAHPGITKLLDAGVYRHVQPYLVLEYVQGEPIDVHCRRYGLDLRARLMLFLQVASAVSYAHRQQVLHRDLKPANVLVTSDGAVRLLDFGIAKLLDNGASVETDLTRKWGRPLTLEYASPEQLRGDPAGITSDVYSLGVILYELLCGMRPHRREGRSPASFEAALLGEVPRLPSEVAVEPSMRQALSGALDAVMMKALRKSMHDRYPSVAALADDVQRFLDRRPVCALDDPPRIDSLEAMASGQAARRSRGPPARDIVLVGRQADRAAVADLLRSRRLVSVVGHGGVGKTELARAVAVVLTDEFAEGVAWVDLAPLTSEEQLVPALAAAVGIELPSGCGQDLLLAALAPRHLLVLIDNCEHLLAPVASLVEQLLAYAPALRVLATSREPLRASGEQVYRLSPLPSPPANANLAQAREYAAFQLLEQGIVRADLGFEFDDRLASVGAEICEALDGVPLPLEMIAAWVPKVGIKGVREMLHERLRLLRGGVRGVPLRQRSLRDLLDWSYGLLTAPEQLALRRLSAFVGAFDVTLAERMLADENTDRWSARELLSSLADKSLVSIGHADGPLYRLLQTTRVYSVERAKEAGESAAIRQRHGAVMVSVAAEFVDEYATTTDDNELVDRFSRYYREVESAFDRACMASDAGTVAWTLRALRAFDGLCGIVVGMEARLVSARRLLAGAEPLVRAKILSADASCGWIRSPSISRTEVSRQAVAQWRLLPGESRSLVMALCHLGFNAAQEGHHDEARSALQEALALADLIVDPHWRATRLVFIAHIEGFLGDRRACLERLREALPLVLAGGRLRFAGYVRMHVIKAAVEAGDVALALSMAPDVMRSMRTLGQREYLAITCHQVARAGLVAGDLEATRVALAEALPLAWEFNRVHEFLEPMAHLAARRGLTPVAARLSGFVQALGATPPKAADELCRAAMDPPALERAMREGAAMSDRACRELAASVLVASDVIAIHAAWAHLALPATLPTRTEQGPSPDPTGG